MGKIDEEELTRVRLQIVVAMLNADVKLKKLVKALAAYYL